MAGTEGVPITEEDWAVARIRARRVGTVTGVIGVVVGALLALVAMAVAEATATGTLRYVLTYAGMVVLSAPLIAVMIRFNVRERSKSDHLIGALTGELAQAVDAADRQAGLRDVQTRHQQFESKLANALEMADDEAEVILAVERSFVSMLPQSPVELLLADNSHAHLVRVASTSPTAAGAGCTVDSPEHCPAARRAQLQYFPDSDALDACPKLRGRIGGPVSAMCVPVPIMGRTGGVIHATGPVDSSIAAASGEFATLAKLAGARLGLIRIMNETQLQASVDSLTGLLNRRSFEQQLSRLRSKNPLMSLAILDLDHFKELNDTYGHETGDRALRLFAQVLTASVREQDVVGRHGGEEFVVALLDCGAASAHEIFEALRTRLEAAITVAALPAFTVSVGVVEAGPGEDLVTLTRRADASLFQAKRDGRDQVVVRGAREDATQAGARVRSVVGPADAAQLRVLRDD